MTGTALLAAVLPWWPIVDALPWGADATKWVARAALDGDWFGWTFAHQHFVGYRPVTALSFVANHALTGHLPLGYRLTDVGLHVAGVALLIALARAWFPGSWAAPAAAAAVLLAHPAVEEVVPFPARRSYLLATDLGLLGLLAHHAALRAGRERAALLFGAATGGLALLAVTSNEVAYVFVPLIVLRTLSERPRALVGVAGPTVAAAALAVGLRASVPGGGVGGYQKRYFAGVWNGTPAWIELPDWQPARIAGALLRYLLTPNGPEGAGPLVASGAGRDALVAVLGAWVLGVGLAAPLRRWRDEEARRRLLLFAWLAGSAAIVVLSQTWFWRQAFTPLFPLALLAAAAISDLARERRPATGLAAAGVVLLLLASAPYGALGGMHVGPHEGARRGTARVRQVEALGLSGPSTAWLALAEREHTAQIVRFWLDRRAAGTGRRHRLVAALGPQALPDRARARVTADAAGVRHLTLSPGFRLADADRFVGLLDRGRLRVDALWRRARSARHGSWLAVGDASGSHAIALRPPADGLLFDGDDAERGPAEEP